MIQGIDSSYDDVAEFEWSRVRFTLGASIGTYSSEVERSIAEIFLLLLLNFFVVTFAGLAVTACPLLGSSH